MQGKTGDKQMCDCIEVVNKKLSEKDMNTQIKVPLLLNSDMSSQCSKVQIVTEKADSGVRKKPVPVFSSFCPFCGEAYKAA